VTASVDVAGAPVGYSRRYLSLAVTCVALTIIGIALTILNVAIPALNRELGASTSDLQWIFASYGLLFSGLVVTGGALGDRYGRRRALVTGLVIFGVASGLGAFATEPAHVVVARSFMGVGAALIMPGTLSVITTVFPPEERQRAIGIWAGVGGLGFILGPPIGGVLLDFFWWGSVMLVSPPVILVTIVATLAIIPESRDPTRTPLDVPGAALSILTISALVYGFIEAPDAGWTGTAVLGAFAVAAVAAVGFVGRELTTAHPMLDVRLFRRPTFTAPALMLVFGFFVVWGLEFLLPQFLEFVRGDSVVVVGMLLASISVTWCLACTLVTRITAHTGERYAIAGGLGLTAVGVLALLPAVGGPSDFWLVVALLVMGAGMGSAMVPSTTLLVAALPPEKAGVGSAMNDVTREFGTAFGVAVLGSVLTLQYQNRLGDAVDVLPADERSRAQSNLGDAVSSGEKLGGDAGDQLLNAARAAFTSGMRVAIVVGALILVATATVTLVLLPHRRHVRRWHWPGPLGRPHHDPAPALLGGEP
jgi:EmrB/QacA subfamily drug resistance transporter